jgi:hypothetical protein
MLTSTCIHVRTHAEQRATAEGIGQGVPARGLFGGMHRNNRKHKRIKNDILRKKLKKKLKKIPCLQWHLLKSLKKSHA